MDEVDPTRVKSDPPPVFFFPWNLPRTPTLFLVTVPAGPSPKGNLPSTRIKVKPSVFISFSLEARPFILDQQPLPIPLFLHRRVPFPSPPPPLPPNPPPFNPPRTPLLSPHCPCSESERATLNREWSFSHSKSRSQIRVGILLSRPAGFFSQHPPPSRAATLIFSFSHGLSTLPFLRGGRNLNLLIKQAFPPPDSDLTPCLAYIFFPFASGGGTHVSPPQLRFLPFPFLSPPLSSCFSVPNNAHPLAVLSLGFQSFKRGNSLSFFSFFFFCFPRRFS